MLEGGVNEFQMCRKVVARNGNCMRKSSAFVEQKREGNGVMDTHKRRRKRDHTMLFRNRQEQNKSLECVESSRRGGTPPNGSMAHSSQRSREEYKVPRAESTEKKAGHIKRSCTRIGGTTKVFDCWRTSGSSSNKGARKVGEHKLYEHSRGF